MSALVSSSHLFLGLLLPFALTACIVRPQAQGGAQHEPGAAGAPAASAAPASPGLSADPKDTMIFLLIGQSNMAGAPGPEAQDELENPRVKVLAYEDCLRLGRTYSRVVSANGLSGIDTAHFDLPGQRELGARYAAAMLELMAQDKARALPPG